MAAKNTMVSARRAFGLFGFLLVAWGFYRLVFRFPTEVEELVLKPLIWLGAMGYMLIKDKKGLASIGLTGKNLFRNLYLGLGLGMVFSIEGIIANVFKYGHLNFVGLGYGNSMFLLALLVSVGTAVSEELVFRGYILSRLREATKNDWVAVVLSSLLFAAIHMPIWIFVHMYTPGELVMQVAVSLVFALGNGLLYTMTGSLVGPIVTHVVWGWAVVLFR